MSTSKNNTSLSNTDALRQYAEEVFALNSRALNSLPQMVAFLIMCVHENRRRTEKQVPSLATISTYSGADLTTEFDRFALSLTGFSKVANLKDDNKGRTDEYLATIVADYEAKRALISRNLRLAVDLLEGGCSTSNFNKDAGQFMLPPAMYLASHVVPAPGSSLLTDKPLPIDGKPILLMIGDKVVPANRSLAHVKLMAEVRRLMNKRQALPVNKITEALKAAGKAKLVTDKAADPKPADKSGAAPADDAKPADDKPSGGTSNDPTGNLGVDGKPITASNPATTELSPGLKQLTLNLRDAVNAYKNAVFQIAPIVDITAHDLTPDGYAALRNTIATLTLMFDTITEQTALYEKERAAEVAKAHAVAKEKEQQKAKRQAAPPIDNATLTAKIETNKAAAAGK